MRPERNVNDMNTATAKAQGLINSPAGCAVLLNIASNPELPLEHCAQPLVSFWLASSATDWRDRRSESNAQALALMAGRDHLETALWISEHPAFAWWYEPFDPTAQVWVSAQFP